MYIKMLGFVQALLKFINPGYGGSVSREEKELGALGTIINRLYLHDSKLLSSY